MRAGGHGVVPIAHSYTDYDQPQYTFSSIGGSGVAFALRRGDTAGLGAWDPGSYVPVWRPPPPMPSERPEPLPPVPEPEEELEMAHDWGHVFRGAAGNVLTGLFGGGGASAPFGVPNLPTTAELGDGGAGTVISGGLGAEACEGMIWTGGTPPKGYKVVHWCGRGVLRKVRRRRRKRLLTASDKADISYIVATTGKGQLAASLIHRSAQ